MHDSREVLIIDVITRRIGARQSLKMPTEILSIPGALFDNIVDKMRSIGSSPELITAQITAYSIQF